MSTRLSQKWISVAKKLALARAVIWQPDCRAGGHNFGFAFTETTSHRALNDAATKLALGEFLLIQTNRVIKWKRPKPYSIRLDAYEQIGLRNPALQPAHID